MTGGGGGAVKLIEESSRLPPHDYGVFSANLVVHQMRPCFRIAAIIVPLYGLQRDRSRNLPKQTSAVKRKCS